MNKLPDLEPITNRPTKCPQCGKTLPVRRIVWDYGSNYSEPRKAVGYRNKYRPHEPFCSNTCGFRYGKAAHRLIRDRVLVLAKHQPTND